MSKYCYLLDAGHGGISPQGKYTTAPAKMWRFKDFTFHEGVFNRLVVAKIAKKMQEAGLDHLLLAHPFLDTSLNQRTTRANAEQKNRKCILFSIHGNASDNPTASGWEVWTSRGESQSDLIANYLYQLAENELKGVMKMRTDSHIRGRHDREANFWMLAKTSMPSVLTENGFFTNEAEARLMLTDDFQEKIAELHFQTALWCEENL